eukprot:2342403-Amphidinium_carterae.2
MPYRVVDLQAQSCEVGEDALRATVSFRPRAVASSGLRLSNSQRSRAGRVSIWLQLQPIGMHNSVEPGGQTAAWPNCKQQSCVAVVRCECWAA